MIVHSPVKPKITTITLCHVLFGCCILTGSTPPIVTNSINLHRQKGNINGETGVHYRQSLKLVQSDSTTLPVGNKRQILTELYCSGKACSAFELC